MKFKLLSKREESIVAKIGDEVFTIGRVSGQLGGCFNKEFQPSFLFFKICFCALCAFLWPYKLLPFNFIYFRGFFTSPRVVIEMAAQAAFDPKVF